MRQAREYLIDLYDDYRNNYLTIEKFAEHNGLHVHHASDLIDLARRIAASQHPDA